MVSKDKINTLLKVPFDHKGQQGYSINHYPKYKELNNEVFYGTMHLSDYSRGNSSVKFIFKDEKGLNYEMFISNFLALAKEKDTSKGITGYWGFLKKGQNYGLTYVKDE